MGHPFVDRLTYPVASKSTAHEYRSFLCRLENRHPDDAAAPAPRFRERSSLDDSHDLAGDEGEPAEHSGGGHGDRIGRSELPGVNGSGVARPGSGEASLPHRSKQFSEAVEGRSEAVLSGFGGRM